MEGVDAATFLSAPDKRRLDAALESLIDELRRRAKEFATMPLDLPEDALLAAVNGDLTIDGNAQTVTIHGVGETFQDIERMTSILVPLEEKHGFALVFTEVTDEGDITR